MGQTKPNSEILNNSYEDGKQAIRVVIVSGGTTLPVSDDTILVYNVNDNSKKMKVDLSQVPTGTTATLYVQDHSYTIADDNDVQANKNEIESHKSDTNNPHQTKISNLSDVNLNTLSSGQALIYNGTNWTNQDIATQTELDNHINNADIHFTQAQISIPHSQISDWSSQTQNDFSTYFSGKTTDDLSEGTTNKYDKTVKFTGGTNVTIDGTYPNFEINDNSASQSDLSTHINDTSNPHQTKVSNLGDVDLTNLADEYILQWDATSSKWKAVQNQAGTQSPLTTKGDIYTYSTTNDRLPVGSDGQILSADSSQSTGLKWITPNFLTSVADDPNPTLSGDLNANGHIITNLPSLSVNGNPVLTATPSERTIYVDNVNGDDTNGDGSEANPYKTVSRAKQDIPDSITQPITIHLKASSTTYDGFVLMNKIFTNTSGSLTIEGEMSVIDSGTISSYQYYANDPTYPDAHVLKVVDSSKSWTNDQFKDKLIRIFDANGNQIHEALIESNTSDTLYIPHMYYGDITNFTYEILDWATTCEKVQLLYIPGAVTIQNLHLENSTYYQVYLKNVAYAVVKYCKIDKTGDKKTAMYVNATALSLNESVLYGHDLNYDGISAGYGTPIYVFIVGTFFRDFRYAVNFSGTQALMFFRDGSRITTPSSSSIARGGIFLNNPGANMSCYSPRGNPVIDCLGTAIILRNTTVQYENFIVYGPNVQTRKDYQFSQEQTAGTIYLKAPVITGTPPSSSSDSGVKGQIAWDTNYLYVCVNDNTWKRVSLSSF